jgi:hypothetical protein
MGQYFIFFFLYDKKPASPKESADKQNDIAIVKPETHNLITTEESQMKDNEIHKQLNQQQLSVPVPEIIQQIGTV